MSHKSADYKTLKGGWKSFFDYTYEGVDVPQDSVNHMKSVFVAGAAAGLRLLLEGKSKKALIQEIEAMEPGIKGEDLSP